MKNKIMMQMPAEGKWFEVNPQAIDESLFCEKRSDENQEQIRLLILEAFAELRQNPERYGRVYETMLPEKTWGSRRVEELQNLASKLGDHMANWVEQAFEWAQRICNGESWETVCNDEDTADWSRLVVWKNGSCRVVGSSKREYVNYSATHISNNDMDFNGWIIYSVPLVVRYK